MTDYAVNKQSSTSAVAITVLTSLLALIVRWYFVTHAQVMQPLYVDSGWGDAAEYYRYAWHMVHHGLFSSDAVSVANPKSDSFRDPGYPVFLALGMLATDDYDHWYALILLAQAAIGAMTVGCAAWTLRHILPTWLLAVAATTMALWPHLVVIPAYVLSENLSALFFAITVLALGEAARKRSLTYITVGGVALALAALTNSVLAPLFIPLAFVLAWKRTIPRRHLLVFVTIVAVPVVAWGIRNSGIKGPYSPLFRAEINLVQGSWPTYHAASQLWGKHDPAGTQTIDAINLEIASLHIDHSLGLKLMAQRMSHAPGNYLAWYVGKPALLWGWEIGLGAGDIYPYPTRNSPFMTNPAMKAIEAVTFVCNGVLALFALTGVILVALHRRPSVAMLTIAVAAVWITLVYGVLQSDPRYSIPFRTGEIALASMAAAAAVHWIRHRGVTVR